MRVTPIHIRACRILTLVLTLLTASLSVLLSTSALAGPPLADCRKLGQVCVEPGATRNIEGWDIYEPCWRWRDTYDCARPKPHQTDCGQLEAASWCSKTGRSCISQREGVCERWRVRWHCTEKPLNAGRATLTSQTYRVRSDRWVSSCGRQEGRRDCRRTNETCSQGPDRRYFKGTYIHRSCWQKRRTYECLDAGFADDCGPLEEDANCKLTETDCYARGPNGGCVNEARVYSCGTDSPGSVSQSCGSASWCVDGDCTDIPRQPANQSFAKAAAGMNLLQEMGKDFGFDGANIAVFRGEKMTCSKWLFGLKNCCRTSGLLLDVDLAECSEKEKKLSAKRAARLTTHADSYCKSKTFFGLCTVRGEDHCVYNSRLGRILQEEARQQISIPKTSCRGLTTAELERVDWSRIDLSEILGDIEARLQPLEAARVKRGVQTRIEAFKTRIDAGGSPAPQRNRQGGQ